MQKGNLSQGELKRIPRRRCSQSISPDQKARLMRVRGRPEVIGVAERVMLPVLITPELLTVGRTAYLEASRTGRFDPRHRCVRRSHHEDRAGREPNRAFSDRTQKESPRSSAPMGADHHTVCLDIGGELRDRFHNAIGPNVRRQSLEGSRRPVRLAPALHDLSHMFPQRRRRLTQVNRKSLALKTVRHCGGCFDVHDVQLRPFVRSCKLARTLDREVAELRVVDADNDDE